MPSEPPKRPAGGRPAVHGEWKRGNRHLHARTPDKADGGHAAARPGSTAARPGSTGRGRREEPARPAGNAASGREASNRGASGRGERIAKLLARAGVGSRRDVERLILQGRVQVGGETLATPATLVSSLAGVLVDGKPVAQQEETRLFLFHKPAGVLTTVRDPGGRATIYDILPPDLPRLMPVGRLDLGTEGLLLLTNDGELKRAMELPLNELPRTYRVRALGEVGERAIEALALGMTVQGIRYGPVDASVDRRARSGGANLWLTMTIREGKNREVRRLCEAIGLKVSRLIRTSYGPFLLGDLPARGLVEVKKAEVLGLKRRFRLDSGGRSR